VSENWLAAIHKLPDLCPLHQRVMARQIVWRLRRTMSCYVGGTRDVLTVDYTNAAGDQA
jgi:hypothetical protein